MCDEIAGNVTGALVPDAGGWVAEEQPEAFRGGPGSHRNPLASQGELGGSETVS